MTDILTQDGNGAAKQKRRIEDLKAEMEAVVNRSRTRERSVAVTEESEEKFENIQANTFFKIMFDTSTSNEEKSAAMEKALTFEGTKEENAERIKEFNKFKEYLQFQRQKMADEFMRLADTKSFSELQGVIREMNDAIIDFDNQMKPLMDILDAVYRLRTAGEGVVLDAYKEIQAEKEAEIERQKLIEEEAHKLETLNQAIQNKRREIVRKREDRSWFGFGKTKKSALKDIQVLQLEISDTQKEVESSQSALQEAQNADLGFQSKLAPDLIDSKDKLRELLDLTSQDHIERQEGLIGAARTFVKTSQERTGSVLINLEKMSDRTQNVINANTMLRSLYAIMNEGAIKAAETNKKKRDELKIESEKEGVTTLEGLETEGKLVAVDNHIQALDITAHDTVRTLNDLHVQGGSMQTMKDRNQAQINKTRSLLSSGIGGVADRLVTVLNGVSQAALSESSDMMGESISIMNSKTRDFQTKEVMQKVLGQQLENDRLLDAIDEFNTFGTMLQKGTELYREQVAESFDILEEARLAAERNKEIVATAAAAHSDARDMNEDGAIKKKGPNAEGENADAVVDPFNLNGPK